LIELSRVADEVAYQARLTRQGNAAEREAKGKTIIGATGKWIGQAASTTEVEKAIAASVAKSENSDLGGREPKSYSVWSATLQRQIGVKDEVLGSAFM
jgi:hypothetical protein